jgi:hypothetical protein
LNSYEIPRDFLIESVPFNTKNGLPSDVLEPLRPKLVAQARRLGHHLSNRLVEVYSHVAPEIEHHHTAPAQRTITPPRQKPPTTQLTDSQPAFRTRMSSRSTPTMDDLVITIHMAEQSSAA